MGRSAWKAARRRTILHSGHLTAFFRPGPCGPPSTVFWLWASMPLIAFFSKLCGHLRDDSGSVMVSSVMGHLTLLRSATACTSSSSASSSSASEMGSASSAVGPRRRGRIAWEGEWEGEDDADGASCGNQVRECGSGGAASGSCCP